MKTKVLLSVALMLAASVHVSQAHSQEKKADAKGGVLDRFKQLEGEWNSKGMHDGKEHEMRVIYKVTAGGSAVVETVDPGTPHEMVTVIHADGDALALTHYCML